MLPEHDRNTREAGGERGRSDRPKRKALKILLLLVLLAATAWGSYSFRGSSAETWLSGIAAGTSRADTGNRAVYYCPMHPEYHSDKPGTCPICGMNLVKADPEEESSQAAGVPEDKQAGGGKVLYWVDPMNPSVKFDKPGKAPDGMDLQPVYADEASSRSLPPGSVKVGPQKRQMIGVEYGRAVEENVSKTVRTVGKVTVDETRIAHVHSRTSGWIEKVYIDFTGKPVKKGQPLLSIYSPDLVSTQQELLIAKKTKDALENSPFAGISSNALSLYQATRERLRLWGVSDAQMNEVEKRGEPLRALTLHAPSSGFVLMRNAFPGQQVSPDMELYSIADFSSVWVLADVYEYELPSIKVGQTATMTLTYFPGRVLKGKVTYIYPEVDRMTRTAKARIEFANQDLELKPDMFANVEFKVDYGKKLTIAKDAVLDSGSEQTVFIAGEDGYFEPRKVTLGQQVGDRYIVLGGLAPGERIVTSANFLIDSESQLKAAMGGMSSGTGGNEAAADHSTMQH